MGFWSGLVGIWKLNWVVIIAYKYILDLKEENLTLLKIIWTYFDYKA